MAQRQYESATVFNARIVDMRHLWEPSREFKGQPTQKPNYFATFILPKAAPQWSNDPGLAGICAAFGKIYQNNPHIIEWPIIDGDLPSPEGKVSEFAKGHWLFSASTGNAPNVEIVQAGGALTKLHQKVGVKPGDYAMAGVTAAVKQNNPRGVKLYLNAVVFSGPGKEIVFANSVSGAELMRMAEQQGLRPAGFSGSPGFGGAPQGGGFNPGGQQFGGFNPGGAPNGGFTHGNAGGFAPPHGAPAHPGFAANPPMTNGPGSGFASPANGGFNPGAVPQNGGFNLGATPQGGFNPGQR